ncbi:MAG: cytochrome P450 [Actinobacteria bacterium]|nr:cytochrome P450 [Actinomycetota bacterium]
MEASTRAVLPPGPPLPKLLQTLGFVVSPARFFDACRSRYGDVVHFKTLFDSGFVMVFDPTLVKEIFKGDPDQLRAGPANELLGPVLGERSVLLLDGAEHLRQRRLMLPAFHGQRLRSYERIMREATDREIDSWPVGEPFQALRSMQALTLDVIMRAVFGVSEGERYRELHRRIREMLDPISQPLGVLVLTLSLARRVRGGSTVQRFEERRRRVDELIYDEIERRRSDPDLADREDVFSSLVLAEDEDGRRMTDQEIRDELVTLLVAGHETTATALAWAFDLLLHDTRVMEELARRLADGDEKYADAFVKEVLRIRPVIPGVGRVVHREPFELAGYTIPVGMEINPSIASIHRRPDSYPAPAELRPERFLEDDPPDTYTWIPFGGGTRRCLGASFATFEMRVVISRVLERATLEAVEAEPDAIQRRGITMVPKNGAPVRLAQAPRAARIAEAAAA